ncbi:uncharacterized protein LOC126571220 [Anopheles aquasalis]|uniref:uncharacterized protein LOC126571220 n=1 Tax=Anopheles aquasalis TaxID=42839 RepID=UPI00215A12E7|nr:uncharacterized protein LOC126571220 [Anopheles aquasalis]
MKKLGKIIKRNIGQQQHRLLSTTISHSSSGGGGGSSSIENGLCNGVGGVGGGEGGGAGAHKEWYRGLSSQPAKSDTDEDDLAGSTPFSKWVKRARPLSFKRISHDGSTGRAPLK